MESIGEPACTKEQVSKYIAPLNHAEAPPISSLRYFTSLRSEVSELLVSDDFRPIAKYRLPPSVNSVTPYQRVVMIDL